MKKKLLSLFLALVMCLSVTSLPALADESTTTIDDAAKDRSPNTEIYTVTKDPGSDYPYYGAKHEPRKGVYYGRTCEGGTFPDGHFGLINASEMADESAVGFYYTVDPSYSLEYWSYLFGSVVKDGSRLFIVYINFGPEDCAAYANGQNDGILTKAFTYLSTLKNPVFVRIGGEMNGWGQPQSFIPAFQHVAALAHSLAPNVATVFSPNFSSGYRVDMDSFYPGDEYVDWIGVSLYYDLYPIQVMPSVSDRDARFLGVGKYGDAMLNVQQAVNLSRIHKKPLMATEGGSANKYDGQDISAEAIARIEKAFAFLPMVYPELKCIISSDYSNSWEPNGFSFYNNPTVTAAYRKAVANNPTYLNKVGDDASYYTKLSAFAGPWTGKMQFAAYTYTPIGDKPTATWSVDGQTRATVSEYPYAFELDVDALGGGEHTLSVTFSNGQTKSYTFGSGSTEPTTPDKPTEPTTPDKPTEPTTTDKPTEPTTPDKPTEPTTTDKPAAPATAPATPTKDNLAVNGTAATPAAYKINGENYFKLRDLAVLLSGTKCQFNVGWDSAQKAVTMTPGQAYEKQADDLKGKPTDSATANLSGDAVYVSGSKTDLTVYKVNGSNYFRLRDLGTLLDFFVGYENGTIVIDTNKPYSK